MLEQDVELRNLPYLGGLSQEQCTHFGPIFNISIYYIYASILFYSVFI